MTINHVLNKKTTLRFKYVIYLFVKIKTICLFKMSVWSSNWSSNNSPVHFAVVQSGCLHSLLRENSYYKNGPFPIIINHIKSVYKIEKRESVIQS